MLLITITFTLILLLLIVITTIRALKSKDKTQIWSPIIFINIYLTYYLLIPFFKNTPPVFGQTLETSLPYLFIGAVLSLVSIHVGFSIQMKNTIFYKYNRLFNDYNLKKMSIGLFCIGFTGYCLINGFHFSLFSIAEAKEFDPTASYNHIDSYLKELISLFCTSVCLLYAQYIKQKRKLLLISVFTISLLIFLIGGSRFRILILVVSFITFYHLYPQVKKVNYIQLIMIGLMFILGMNIIERTRNYGKGLDLTKLQNIDYQDLKDGASENQFVYEFSALVMEKYSEKEKIYVEPLLTAICMPIPRTIFPYKPKGLYLREANMEVLHTLTYGAAFLYFVEAFLSFGFIGIILQGILIGFLSRVFWDNYQKNQSSIGAILLLSLYNGILYVIISRGYLAQAFIVYMFFLIIPFWICKFLWRNTTTSSSKTFRRSIK